MTGLNRIKIFYAGMEASSELARNLNYHEGFEYVRAPGHSYYENHLCISKEWPNAQELVLKFNAGLQAIKVSGEYDKIRQKYQSISEWNTK